MNWDLFDKALIKISMMSVTQPTGDPVDSPKNRSVPGVAGLPAPPQNPQPQVQAQAPKMPGVKTPVIPDPTKQTKSKGTLPDVAKATNIPKFGAARPTPGLLRRIMARIVGAPKKVTQTSKTVVVPAWKQKKLYRHGVPLAVGALGLYGGHKALSREQEEPDLDELRRAGLVIDEYPDSESTRLNTE